MPHIHQFSKAICIQLELQLNMLYRLIELDDDCEVWYREPETDGFPRFKFIVTCYGCYKPSQPAFLIYNTVEDLELGTYRPGQQVHDVGPVFAVGYTMKEVMADFQADPFLVYGYHQRYNSRPSAHIRQKFQSSPPSSTLSTTR